MPMTAGQSWAGCRSTAPPSAGLALLGAAPASSTALVPSSRLATIPVRQSIVLAYLDDVDPGCASGRCTLMWTGAVLCVQEEDTLAPMLSGALPDSQQQPGAFSLGGGGSQQQQSFRGTYGPELSQQEQELLAYQQQQQQHNALLALQQQQQQAAVAAASQQAFSQLGGLPASSPQLDGGWGG